MIYWLQRIGIKETKPIQSYAWPAILRGCSVFMVSGAKTGKTMAYLPGLITFLLEMKERYPQLPKVISPMTIILCPGTNEIEEMFHFVNNDLNLQELKSRSILVVRPIDKKCLVSFFHFNITKVILCNQMIYFDNFTELLPKTI